MPANTNKKRFPLQKRFSAALSEDAYAALRALNEKYGYGNNYLMTIIFENIEALTTEDKLDAVFQRYIDEYGAPAPGGMSRAQKDD